MSHFDTVSELCSEQSLRYEAVHHAISAIGGETEHHHTGRRLEESMRGAASNISSHHVLFEIDCEVQYCTYNASAIIGNTIVSPLCVPDCAAMGSCDGARPSCTVSSYTDEEHGREVDITDEDTCIQHDGVWGQSLLRSMMEKMNWPKTQTHLAASFVMMSMWFVHHLVFLAPHTHGDEHAPHGHELQHSDVRSHGGGGLTEPLASAFTTNSGGAGERDSELWRASMVWGSHQEPIGHDESDSILLSVANVFSMLMVALVPYCVNSTVTWKGLSHASTFPVFCLGVVVALYTASMFCVLGCLPLPEKSQVVARRSLWLQYGTAALLMGLAAITSGGWSIDIIIFISPLITLFHTQALQLWSNLRDRNSGFCIFN